MRGIPHSQLLARWIASCVLAFGATSAPLSAQQATPAHHNASKSIATYDNISPASKPVETRRAAVTKSRATLPDVVVTAEKREQPLQEVPMSVSNFSAEELDMANIDNPRALERLTPGLVYNDFVGFSVIYLRGVGTDQFLPSGDPSVTTYIDGIYTPFAHALATEFGQVERIEVLKGPQGTLYGRNSTGGAINIITAPPQQEFGLSTSGRFGNFDARKWKGYITGSLTDDLRVGLSLVHDQHDSYYRRPGASPRPAFRKTEFDGAQLRIDWDITDSLALDLVAIHSWQDGTGTALVNAFAPKPLFQIIKPLFTSLLTNRSAAPLPAYVSDPDVPPRLKARNGLYYGHLRWTPKHLPFDVKLSGSYQQVTTLTQFDFEGTIVPLATFRPTDMGANIATAELQIRSDNSGNGFLAQHLEWTVGYYFFDEWDAGFRDVQFSLLESLTDPLLEEPLTAVSALLDSLAGISVPSGVDLYLNGLVDTRSNAVYGQARWAFTDWLGLTLGARYTREQRHLAQSQLALFNADGSHTTLRRDPPQRRSYNNFSPKVVLDAHPFAHTMIYASWQRAFKSGTFNVLNILKPPSSVLPERNTAYEVGIKGDLLHGDLEYQFAAFYNDIRNLQTLILSLESSGAVTLDNVPKTVTKGLELNFKWLPLARWLPGLMLSAGGTYLDSEFVDYPNGFGFDPQTGLFRDNLNLTGNTGVRAPRYTAVLGAQYRHPIYGGPFDGALFASVNSAFNSGYYFDAQNLARQPSFQTLQARVGYRNRPTGLTLSLYGENLTNERHWQNQFQTDFNTVGTLAAPRLIGVQIRWQFGACNRDFSGCD